MHIDRTKKHEGFCEPFSAVAVSPDLSCLGNPETQKICNPNHKKPRPMEINQKLLSMFDLLTIFIMNLFLKISEEDQERKQILV